MKIVISNFETLLEYLKKEKNYAFNEDYENSLYRYLFIDKSILCRLKIVVPNVLIIGNNNFVDSSWLIDIIKNSSIDKNGISIISTKDQFHLKILNTIVYQNFIDYGSKIEINRLAKMFSIDQYLDNERMKQYFQEFLTNNNYQCQVKYHKKFDEKTLELPIKITGITKLRIYMNIISRKIATFTMKSFFNIYKKFSKLRKIRKIRKFKEVQEINKNKSNYGCSYYIINGKNKKFLKGFDYYKSFQNEIIALKRVTKLNPKLFLRLQDYDFNDYVCVEFCNGVSLKDYIEKSPLTRKESKYLIVFLTEVLEVLYEANIIHRDIRPENIMVIQKSETIEFKIIDFGFCVIDNKDILDSNKFFDQKILKSLGDEYKKNEYEWDDSIAILNLIEECIENPYQRFPNEISKIQQIVGRRQYKVEVG